MKLKIISKNRNRSIYGVEKKQEFWKRAREFLSKSQVKEGYIKSLGYKDGKNKEEDIRKIKDAKYINHFGGKDLSIDFIFGDKIVFIVISYRRDMQKKFSNLIYKTFVD